jgi:hypothetical protein
MHIDLGCVLFVCNIRAQTDEIRKAHHDDIPNGARNALQSPALGCIPELESGFSSTRSKFIGFGTIF